MFQKKRELREPLPSIHWESKREVVHTYSKKRELQCERFLKALGE